MKRYKETRMQTFLRCFLNDYLPNSRDNLKRLITKLLFLISVCALIAGSFYIGGFYYGNAKEKKILESQRQALQNGGLSDIFGRLSSENSDYKAWLSIGDTQLSNPVYQTDNNSFYLNHNSRKEKSRYGALFFDYRSLITGSKRDKNLVIYGNSPSGETLFGNLSKLRTLSVYKKNSVVNLLTKNGGYDYKVYAIFVLNAKEADEKGSTYNIYRKKFSDEDDFESWCKEAKERSVINTQVNVKMQDNILTLVSECDDFEDARLVVMAREVRNDETVELDSPSATVNNKPRYPKKWYDVRNIKYPFSE